MKLTTSFSPPVGNLAPWLAAVFWAITLVIGVMSIWSVVAARGMQQEKPALRERLGQIEDRKQKAVSQEKLPSAKDLAALKQRVALVNSLAGHRGWSTSVLLAKLEKLLPKQAALASLHHKTKEGEVVIVAESRNVEILTAFLLKLEQEPHFAEVLLTKQARHKAMGRKSVQFEVRIKERL